MNEYIKLDREKLIRPQLCPKNDRQLREAENRTEEMSFHREEHMNLLLSAKLSALKTYVQGALYVL